MNGTYRRIGLWVGIVVVLGTAQVQASPPRKPKITSVHFEGNQAFKEKRLYRLMFSRPSTLLRRSYYHPDVLKEDLKNLEGFYQQNGYLEAGITDHQVEVDSTRNEVHIRIQVSEGEVTRIEGVGVFGNRVFSDKELLSNVNIHAGDPFRRKNIEDALVAMLTLYADNGYLDAEVQPDVQVNTETHRALIDFAVEEKAQCTIDGIRLTGLQKTRPHVVRRELRFRSGQVVKYSRLLESQRRLYLTGLFQGVFLRPQPSISADSTKRDILIELKERGSGEFNVSVGYDSVEKLRGKVEVSNTNLWGTALKLGGAAKMSFTRYGVEASFTQPWTFGTPWRTDINMTMDYKEEPGYNQNRLGGWITFGRSFLRRSTTTLTYRQEKVKLSHIHVRTVPEERKTNIRSLKLAFLYDTRDNLFNSTEGVYMEWSNEWVGSFLGGTHSFVRSLGQFKWFYPWNRSTILATAIEAGWMDMQEIPLNERFYAGGPNSLRAFEDQKAGPLDENRVPIGGSLKVVWNVLEIRRSLYKMIGGVLFAEVGNVWSTSEHFNFRDLRPAAGFGLRVNAPIGLVRLDYGFNLDRQAGEPGSKVYFSMGQAF